jgi:hypothetical protein
MSALPPRQRPLRRHPPRSLLTSSLLGGLTAASLSLLAAEAEAAPTYQKRVLSTDLRNPRGITLAGNRLLVSEAGAGGTRLPDGSNCILSGSGREICSGNTGAIGAWDPGTQTYTRLLNGLPSLAQADGSEGTGIADLAVGGPTGLLGVFGLGGNPNQPNVASLGSPLFGQVVSIDLSTGTLQPRSNLAAYERDNNPDQRATPNSNPYALAPFGNRLYVTDAGGNTLLTLDPTPDPSTGSFAILGNFVFPPPLVNTEPVPTGLAVQSSGSTGQQLLIGELSGFPFAPGAANVFATDGTSPPSLSLSGFTLITDIATSLDGDLYVLEYASNFFHPAGNGSIWRVAGNGSRERIIAGLSQPTSLAVASDGTLYVTNNSDSLAGELLEYRPSVPAPLPLLGAAAAWHQARRLRRRSKAKLSY